MKRVFLLISVILMVVLVGCRKDTLDYGNVGFLRLELKKGYSTQNKGAVESFFGTVKVVYGDEEIVYNCLFSDPSNSGFYTNDASEGDRIYVRKDVEFRIIIEAEVDGYLVSGESAPMMYSDGMDMLSVEIVLRAGSSRIAIYQPREDEIFGNYVVAYGEILENVGTRPIRETGIMLVRKSIYDTYQSADNFTFENEQGNSNDWTVEYYYAGHDNEESDAEITKFSVVLRGLDQNTAYCMRAFAFTESDSSMNWCYSRVVEFSTNNNVARDISVVTNDADNVSMDGVDVAGRVVLLDGNSPDSVAEMGFIFDTYNNYVANSSNLDYYRNNSFIYPASDPERTDNMIIFSANVTGLQEGVTYVFRAYATFREQPYYGAVRMFAVPQNPDNIRIQADEITSALTSAYVDLQGNIINDAGYEFSEVGFVYRFYDRSEAPSSVYDLNGTATGSLMSGRFASRVNLPIVNKTMYYAPYAITTTGYTVYGDLSSAVSVEPANVPSISIDPQQNVSGITTHSMTVSCYVEANGRSDCECGIVFTTDTSNHASYDTVRKASSSNGTEEFLLNGLTKGTSYTYWAYIKVVDESITTDQYSAVTLTEGDRGPGGGIIFYADDNNGFALEYYVPGQMGPDNEFGDSAIWGSNAGIALNTDAPSSITVSGRTNTEAIVSYHNRIGFTNEYAALKCYQSAQGGKNDWYLPTSVEIQALFDSDYDEELYPNYDGYWTSDEQDAGNAIAYIVSYDTGSSYNRQTTPKETLLNYILVRRF